jgi:pimeloyl-ACP methyl ester carboxylesterase
MTSQEKSLQRVEANGVCLAYEEHGSLTDPVMLLIMGLGQQMIGWPNEFVDMLVESHFRVIRYDNRDIGLSTWIEDKAAISPAVFLEARRDGVVLPVPYTLTDMADDAIGLMDALRIEAAHIAGASMGGMIAQVLAAKAPDRVLSLISMMSSSGNERLPGPSPEIQSRLFVGPPKGATPEQLLEYTAETLRMIAYPDPQRPPDAFQVLVNRAAKRGVNRAGYARQLLAIVEDGSRVERLSTIKSPTLVIHGAADPLVPVACGMDTAAHIAGARLEVVEAMAHDLPPSQMRRLATMITEFATNA